MIADPNALLAAVQAQAAGQAGQGGPAPAAPLAAANADLAVLASRYSAGAAQGATAAQANQAAAKAVSDKDAAASSSLYASRANTAGVEVGAARSRAAATAASSKAQLEQDRVEGQIRMINLQRQIASQAETEAAKDGARREALAEQKQAEFMGHAFQRYGPRFNGALTELLSLARSAGLPATAAVKSIPTILKDPKFAGVSPDYLVEELANYDRYVEGDIAGLDNSPVAPAVRQLAGAPAPKQSSGGLMGLARRILPF